MKIYIIRHGETAENKAHHFQGQVDTHLDEDGRAQAERAGEHIRRMGLQFDRIYCSPLSRAVETIEIVTGLDRSHFILDDRLKEISFGRLESTPFDRHNPLAGTLFTDPASYVPSPGAESIADVKKRTGNFLEELRDTQPGQSILVGCHGGAMRCMLTDLGYINEHNMWDQMIGNCAIFEITLMPDGHLKVTREMNTQDKFFH